MSQALTLLSAEQWHFLFVAQKYSTTIDTIKYLLKDKDNKDAFIYFSCFASLFVRLAAS